MKSVSQLIDALDNLIELHNKRQDHYRKLIGKAEDENLRALFGHYADLSRRFIENIGIWRSAIACASLITLPKKRPSKNSLWSQFRSVFSPQGDWLAQTKVIEKETIGAYRKLTEMASLPAAAITDFNKQLRDVEKVMSRVERIKEANHVSPLGIKIQAEA
jgi:hypothetical protein